MYSRRDITDYFLRKLRSVDVSTKMLHILSKFVVKSATCFAAICWCSSIRASDPKKLNKLTKTFLQTSQKGRSHTSSQLICSQLIYSQGCLKLFHTGIPFCSSPIAGCSSRGKAVIFQSKGWGFNSWLPQATCRSILGQDIKTHCLVMHRCMNVCDREKSPV